MDLMNILYFVVGFGGAYVLVLLIDKKNKWLSSLVKSIKKRHPIIFLETDKASYFRPTARFFKNLAITPDKEVIVVPKSSPKPCLNLGGVEIIHADLYKSIGTPRELRLFIDELIENDGWSQEDVSKFFEEIEIISPDIIMKYFEDNMKAIKTDGNNGSAEKNGNGEKRKAVKEKLKKKIEIYKSLPSVVKDFIYTGINRVSLHAMIREMVYQRELEKVGGRNWLAIAIAIMIIAVAVGIAFRFIFQTPGVMEGLAGAVVGPERIAP